MLYYNLQGLSLYNRSESIGSRHVQLQVKKLDRVDICACQRNVGCWRGGIYHDVLFERSTSTQSVGPIATDDDLAFPFISEILDRVYDCRVCDDPINASNCSVQVCT
jgi:hypothetical protein